MRDGGKELKRKGTYGGREGGQYQRETMIKEKENNYIYEQEVKKDGDKKRRKAEGKRK